MPEVKIVKAVAINEGFDESTCKRIAAEGITNWDTVIQRDLDNLRWYVSQKNYNQAWNSDERYFLLVKDEHSISESLQDVKVWLDKAEKEKAKAAEKERKRKENLARRKEEKKLNELKLLEELKKKYENGK